MSHLTCKTSTWRVRKSASVILRKQLEENDAIHICPSSSPENVIELTHSVNNEMIYLPFCRLSPAIYNGGQPIVGAELFALTAVGNYIDSSEYEMVVDAY